MDIILYGIGMALFETTAQVLLKIGEANSWRFFMGILFYIGLGYIINKSYHLFGFAQMNIIWSSMNLLFVLLFQYLIDGKLFIKEITSILLLIYISYINS